MVRNRAPYCFKLPELAVPNLPFVKIMQVSFEDLTSLDDNKSSDAWKEFLFNAGAVTAFLRQSDPERVHAVLMAGAGWTGTGKAVKAIRTLTGLALVSPRFHEYLNAFLLSIALAADLEVPTLELSDRASDVAFTLSECWQSERGADSRRACPTQVASTECEV